MGQQLTYKEMEIIGEQCRHLRSDGSVTLEQLSLSRIERIEEECRRHRSAYIADAFVSLFKGIGSKPAGFIAVLKSGAHGNKTVGASAR